MSKESKIDWGQIFKPEHLFYLFVGVGCAVFAMKGFMIPNAFMDGGVTGVSILLHEITHVNISLFILGFNSIFVYLGYRYIGRTFAFQTGLAIVLLAIGLLTVEFDSITHDKLLIAFFGGLFIGTGMGFVIRSGGVIDGAEILAIFSTKKVGITVGEMIMGFNIVIFLVAALEIGIEQAMYSIITYITATKMCDYVVDGFEEYVALHIISSQHDAIKSLIVNDLNKGIAVYKGERGYLPDSFEVHSDVDIIVTIITRLEILKIKEAVYALDDRAFIYVTSVKEAKGGILKKKNVH